MKGVLPVQKTTAQMQDEPVKNVLKSVRVNSSRKRSNSHEIQ